MKKSALLAALALTAMLVSPASAQVFVGSDNFNDDTLTIQSTGAVNGVGSTPFNQAAGLWRAQVIGTGGGFSETNQRLEYTNSSTSGAFYSATRWNTPSFSVNGAPSGLNLGIGGTGLTTGAPFTSSWSARVELSNLTTPSAGYTLTGMELYTTPSTGTVDAYYGIYLSNDATLGNRLMVEVGIGTGTAGNYTRTPSFFNIGDAQDVTVRATYDGSSKIMAFDYSTNGSTFLPTGVAYDLDGVHAMIESPSFGGGMGLGLIGFQNGATGAITSGQMYYDNFAVSAIPEPSTYAALAGLGALGLAFWRRRQARATAQA